MPAPLFKPAIAVSTLALLFFASGCDSDADADGPGGGTGAGGAGGAGGTSTGGESAGGESAGGAGGAPGDPEVTVRITANTDPFPHADGLAGQTAIAASGGVRSLMLYKDASDLEPLVVFDHGANVVEVGYDDLSETEVAVVPTSTLVGGTYTIARMSQSYSRYQIAATLHPLNGAPVAGELDNLLVMSDGTMVDGQMRDAGYYEFAFLGGGDSFDTTGEDFPIPIYSFTAGASAVHEQGEWAVYFPVNVELPDDPTLDVELRIDVNLDHAFRWTDLLLLGYELDVFDITEISYEPVIRFGGNHFEMTVATQSQ